jgi:hypothetical protein
MSRKGLVALDEVCCASTSFGVVRNVEVVAAVYVLYAICRCGGG